MRSTNSSVLSAAAGIVFLAACASTGSTSGGLGLGDPCNKDWQCDDGLACNGLEYCNKVCKAGTPVNCDDSNLCTTDTCLEPTGECKNEKIDCDDGIACTDDYCKESTGVCQHPPIDGWCQDGAWCNGAEICNPSSGCTSGTPPDCTDTVTCTIDECNETYDTCTHTPNHSACSNSSYCDGAEVCDPLTGCVAGEAIDCDDEVSCTYDYCDDYADKCVNWPDVQLCPPAADECQYPICDIVSDCGFINAPEGADCTLPDLTAGLCNGAGLCVEDVCGNGHLFPDEECEAGLQLVGCSLLDCLTEDFVVSDPDLFTSDDGREETGRSGTSVAGLGEGRFVAVWTQENEDDPLYADLRARVVNVYAPFPAEELVITDSAMPQGEPAVAAAPYGGYVVAWQGYGTDAETDDVDIYFAVCRPEGGGMGYKGGGSGACTLGPARRANTITGEAQLHPAVAIAAGFGEIYLAWEDWSPGAEGPDPWSLSGIRLRKFQADGTPDPAWGVERLVNTSFSGAQIEPTVAALWSGEALVAWTDQSGAAPDTSGSAVRARLYDAMGATVGNDFVVNEGATEWEQYDPSAAWVAEPELGFVVAWTHMEASGRLTVRANFVPEIGGVDADLELNIPLATADTQHSPAVGSSGWYTTSSYVTVAWVNEPADGSTVADDEVSAIVAARLEVDCSEGGLCGLERTSAADVVLNTTMPDAQEKPSVAYGYSELVTAWTDWSGEDGSGGLCEVRARYMPQGWVLE